MTRRAARLSLFGVALLIGLLLVGQLRSQARPRELSTLSPSELSTLIDTLSSRNQELSAGLGDLNEQLRSYRLSESQGQSTLTLQRKDLRRITAFAAQDCHSRVHVEPQRRCLSRRHPLANPLGGRAAPKTRVKRRPVRVDLLRIGCGGDFAPRRETRIEQALRDQLVGRR